MGRSPCCDEVGLKKGPWTTEEDKKLIDYVSKHGHRSWRALPKLAGLNRCGKSCRLRWTNYLRPDIKRGKFTEEEERHIIELHSRLGNKWSAIAANLPGRTDNEIKNYWNTHIRKKLLRLGIDPVTHRPRADLSLLANLPQYFAGNSSVAAALQGDLRAQADATQLARLQLAQTLVQVLTGYGSLAAPLPTMDATNLMGSGFLQNQIDSLGLSQCPTQNLPPSLCSLEQNLGDGLVPSFKGATFSKPNAFGFESATPTTNSTPSMPSASSESIVVDQVRNLPNPSNIDPSTANYNEPWEGLEDLCGDLYWKNILDQLTPPTCYNS